MEYLPYQLVQDFFHQQCLSNLWGIFLAFMTSKLQSKKAVMASLISCGLFGASVFSSFCAGLSKTHGEGAEFLLCSMKCRDLAWNFES